MDYPMYAANHINWACKHLLATFLPSVPQTAELFQWQPGPNSTSGQLSRPQHHWQLGGTSGWMSTEVKWVQLGIPKNNEESIGNWTVLVAGCQQRWTLWCEHGLKFQGVKKNPVLRHESLKETLEQNGRHASRLFENTLEKDNNWKHEHHISMNIMRNLKLAFSFLPLGSSFPSTSWPGLNPLDYHCQISKIDLLWQCVSVWWQTCSTPKRVIFLSHEMSNSSINPTSGPSPSHGDCRSCFSSTSGSPPNPNHPISPFNCSRFSGTCTPCNSSKVLWEQIKNWNKKVIFSICRNVCGAHANFLS